MWDHYAYFDTNRYIVNRGISGDDSAYLSKRSDADCIHLNPKKAVMMIGTNDIIRTDYDFWWRKEGEIAEANHNGIFPAEKSFFKCDGAYLSAVKKSEVSNDIILRIVEENGENTVAEVTINGRVFSVPLKPFEIRTVAFNGKEIRRVNMLEN